MRTAFRLLGVALLLACAIPTALRAQSNVVLSLDICTNGLTGWQTVHTVVTNMPSSQQAFYRMRIVTTNAPLPPPTNVMSLIPAGSFSMGNALSASGEGEPEELPVHAVNVSAFYIDKYEVTKALWDEVRAWGLSNGYTDLAAGAGKEANHPVHSISWHDMVKWSNARSQREGLTECYTVAGSVYKTGSSDAVVMDMGASGYRLPTEAEWEKAARGGLSGMRFPWGDTISHSQANYFSLDLFAYDVSPTPGNHPSYATGGYPYSSPVGSFAPNGYGLYDMVGNMWEFCWDRYDANYYASSPSSDPTGAASGDSRVLRGGNWGSIARISRISFRMPVPAVGSSDFGIGFRCVRR